MALAYIENIPLVCQWPSLPVQRRQQGLVVGAAKNHTDMICHWSSGMLKVSLSTNAGYASIWYYLCWYCCHCSGPLISNYKCNWVFDWPLHCVQSTIHHLPPEIQQFCHCRNRISLSFEAVWVHRLVAAVYSKSSFHSSWTATNLSQNSEHRKRLF